MWKIVYNRSIKKDLKSIPEKTKYLIKRTIEEKLMIDPIRFGIPLRRNLKGLMKRKVGDYRIIYSIEKKIVTIFVIKISHRKEEYT